MMGKVQKCIHINKTRFRKFRVLAENRSNRATPYYNLPIVANRVINDMTITCGGPLTVEHPQQPYLLDVAVLLAQVLRVSYNRLFGPN